MTKTARSPAGLMKALLFSMLCVITALALARPARAEIEINVNRADVQPLPIAVPAFGGGQVGGDIAQVIGANLQVYERLTGEKGYFDTRVVFVAESGARGKTTKRLAIMDQDGANPSYLTGGDSIVMTPRFSPTSQEITYMALRPDSASVYLYNLESGRRESLGSFQGMVFAPRFSPDGGRVAFSVERGGNSDIYVMNLSNRASSRLTSDPSIDTSPSFSPDGTRIVFNSDRSGSPQLYVMGADGSGARRISNGSGRYTTPVWSPTGEFVAFTKQAGGQFHIGVMRPDGSDERLLTTSYLDEGPTWAPNGRVLMFSRETPGGPPKLWSVDVTGRILQPMPYPGAGSDPAWSPLLN